MMNSFTWAEILCGISCFSPTQFHACRSIGHIIQTEKEKERENKKKRRMKNARLPVQRTSIAFSARPPFSMSASFKVSDVTARETDDRLASADLSHERQRIVSLSLYASAHSLSGKLESAEPSRETQSRCAS